MVKEYVGSIPARFWIHGKIGNNVIRQMERDVTHANLIVKEIPGMRGRISSLQVTLPAGETISIIRKGAEFIHEDGPVLMMSGLRLPTTAPEWQLGQSGTSSWVRPTALMPEHEDNEAVQRRHAAVIESWRNQFFFREEEYLPDGTLIQGLRTPQVGALHAILAHWKVSLAPATIVMPTGTGKTETMLAILVANRVPRLIVIVPTDALRTQIAGKFTSLGWLKKLGIVNASAHYPVVGILTEIPTSVESIASILKHCNVVVTTMAIAAGSSTEVQDTMTEWASHLFIDEAHHIAATTWDLFKAKLDGKPVLQFTATPFRQDGKTVDGKIIFNYPLKKAQSEGYFRNITFKPIVEFDSDLADKAICVAGVEALQRDLEAGFDHILMARVASIKRAEFVHLLYVEQAPQHSPVVIHSRMTLVARRQALASLYARTARIIVCVDMLGEGFDLPELKIAALHDMHKSLAITLQFTGRFTRTNSNIGDATIVANIAAAGVEQRLQELYAEDADWNDLLRILSEHATGREVRRSEFVEGFRESNPKISLQNIFPKMSAVVYKTACNQWNPEDITLQIADHRRYAGPFINRDENTLIVVTRDRVVVPWGNIRDLREVYWHLYLLHWDKEQNLLFINSSDNSSLHEDLAQAVAGTAAQLIRGEQVFRSLHGINRFIIMSLGLRHLLSRTVQFSMHNGSDVGKALTNAMRENKSKSNLFGKGFEKGKSTTLGCSQKGRLWSHRIAYDLSEWVDWCHEVGAKLIDDTISTEEIFRNVVIPKIIAERPAVVPIAVDWDAEMMGRSEERVFFNFGVGPVPLHEVSLSMVEPDTAGPLKFSLTTEGHAVEYEIRLSEKEAVYVRTSGPSVAILFGRKCEPLEEWFSKEPPTIYFADGSSLIFNELYALPVGHRRPPFSADRILTWDWTGTNIRMESQRTEKRPESIQRRVITALFAATGPDWLDVIFDDDGSGEIADIVTLRVHEGHLFVQLYHCKFAGADQPGARVDELYVVCGQAQRSVVWRGVIARMLEHMRHREVLRSRQGFSRFERGDLKFLRSVLQRLPILDTHLEIYVVQPGVSKQGISAAQLELLGVTENYLRETYDVDFWVIASP